VRASGLEVNEYLTLGRTIIGASAWALHAKGVIFEQRAEEFRPERWLEADEVERERMDNALFSFGYESRNYIGKSIR
jgi:cytochrome P450